MTLDPFNAFLHLDPQPGDGGPAIGVKDVIDVAGMPTTAASKVLRRMPEEDAECVARLRAAGATIAGKLNTHEFAYGALTNSPHFGPALNPWNPEHGCGGSSGGSGAAVAAGLVDAALGTDTAGSVRIPAAFCGVTGMRPSWGLVPTRGVVPTAWSLDTVGPLAWSAEECERLLETMAGRPLGGRDAGDDLRVGVLTRLFEAPSRRWRRRASVRSPSCPVRRSRSRSRSTRRCRRSRSWSCSRRPRTPTSTGCARGSADYGADVRARLLAGLLLPSTAYTTGLRARRWARAEHERALGGYDLLVAPAMPITAPRLDAIPEDYRLLLMPYNSPAALLGLPALSVPCGFVDGLPVGLSLMGRRGEDATPLAAAKAFQRVTDWHTQRPERALSRVAA